MHFSSEYQSSSNAEADLYAFKMYQFTKKKNSGPKTKICVLGNVNLIAICRNFLIIFTRVPRAFERNFEARPNVSPGPKIFSLSRFCSLPYNRINLSGPSGAPRNSMVQGASRQPRAFVCVEIFEFGIKGIFFCSLLC